MDDVIIHHKIRCKFSGLFVGDLSVRSTAGVLPYVSYWDKCIAYHPVFSLPTDKLLKFTEYEWKRLAQRAVDAEITQAESDILCVSFLAILHKLDSLKQDTQGLPPLSIVQGTIEKLFYLAAWKWHLESQKFAFPTLHISKNNNNADFSNINDYLDLCYERTKEYEHQLDDLQEQEQLKSAQRAAKALASEWVTPASKKTLWRWVRAHLPAQYEPDAQGWLSTLFLGGSAAIIDFTEEDIDLAEEIIVSACPGGNGIMFAVRSRLKAIRAAWDQHHKSFEIDMTDFAEHSNMFVNGEKVAAPHPGSEPLASEFAGNRGKFIIAHARWTIAKSAFLKSGGIL